VTDCDAYGRLTRLYSVSELDTALAQIPTAVQEYTNCYAIIQDALLAEVPGSRLGGGGASQSSSSPFLPLPVFIVLAVLVASGAGLGVVARRRR
jgi:hypothetical protein